MILEAWILMDQIALDILWAAAHTESPPENLKLITNGVRGFWNDIATDEVINVIGTSQEINDLVALIGVDVNVVYAWDQGPGYDSLDDFPTVPPGVLALMKDHIEPPAPATFSNPNWGHVFLGQSERIFAGQFSDEFTEEFL